MRYTNTISHVIYSSFVIENKSNVVMTHKTEQVFQKMHQNNNHKVKFSPLPMNDFLFNVEDFVQIHVAGNDSPTFASYNRKNTL